VICLATSPPARSTASSRPRGPRRVALLACAALLGLAACGRGPEPRARRIVLITCDTLRADRLGTYGYERPTSPSLDAFAKECVVFDECTSASSITGPSLSSLMTGLLPDELGASSNGFQMPAEAVTVAELARGAGWATAGVVSNYVLKRFPELGEAGLHQGFEHWDDEMHVPEKNRPDLFERTAPDTARAAIAWLEGRRAAGADRFFLWVHFQDPHGPYVPPAEIAERFDRPHGDDVLLPVGRGRFGLGEIPGYQVLGDADHPERRPGVYRDRYDAEVRTFDDALGALVGWLRGAGWLDDALVVITADHGEALGEHGYWFCHGETLYRELVRVPLLVRYPAGAPRPAGPRVATGVAHLDLWPTLLEALGVAPRPNRGTSLFNAELPAGRAFVSMIHAPEENLRWTAVYDGRHRMLFPPGSRRPQLFDDALDPGEERNLVDVQPGVALRLVSRHREILSGMRPALRPVPIDFRNPERMRALADIGYAGSSDDADGDPEAEPAQPEKR
jgi:arylsulfatase A-like enzyme